MYSRATGRPHLGHLKNTRPNRHTEFARTVHVAVTSRASIVQVPSPDCPGQILCGPPFDVPLTVEVRQYTPASALAVEDRMQLLEGSATASMTDLTGSFGS